MSLRTITRYQCVIASVCTYKCVIRLIDNVSQNIVEKQRKHQLSDRTILNEKGVFFDSFHLVDTDRMSDRFS